MVIINIATPCGYARYIASYPGPLGNGASEEGKESLVQTDRKSAHCALRNLVGSFS